MTMSGASPTRCSTSPVTSTASARPDSNNKTCKKYPKARLSGIFSSSYVIHQSDGLARKTSSGMTTVRKRKKSFISLSEASQERKGVLIHDRQKMQITKERQNSML